MAIGLKTNFQDSEDIVFCLNAALKQEKKKYENVPIVPDLMPEFLMTQAGGPLLLLTALMELSSEALLHVPEKLVPAKHSLPTPFNLFDSGDKEILRSFYTDFKATSRDPLLVGVAAGHHSGHSR